MTLAADMSADLDDVLLDTEEFAEAIVYTPAGGGSPVNCNAIVQRDEDVAIQVLEFSEEERKSGLIFCATADVASPVQGDTITALSGAETWKINRRVSHDKYGGQTLACILIRRETVGGATRLGSN